AYNIFIVNKKMKFFIHNGDKSSWMNKFNYKMVNIVSTYSKGRCFFIQKIKGSEYMVRKLRCNIQKYFRKEVITW
ncbi:TPA: hypothetical protein ACOIAU_004020, partial [Clostridioides difficile]